MSTWSKEETEILKKYANKKDISYIARKVGKSKKAVSAKIYRMGISRKKTWSKEEEKILREYAGETSVTAIAKMLGRSNSAVKNRAVVLGISIAREGEYISCGTILKELGLSASHKWEKERWEKLGLIFEKHLVRNRLVYAFRMDLFWKWAEQHKTLLDFSKLAHNAFGDEPEWVKEKIDIDRAHAKEKNIKWTPKEEERLINLTKNGLDVIRIANELNRTQSAVIAKLERMDTKVRPAYKDNKYWTEEETERLIELKSKGYSVEAISNMLGRNIGSIKNKLRRLNREAIEDGTYAVGQ